MVAVFVTLLLLGVRSLISLDLGYNLVLEAAALEVTDSPWLWSTLGSAYASRADARRMAGEPGYIHDFQVARIRFQQALDIQPDYEFAQQTLARVEKMIAGSSD